MRRLSRYIYSTVTASILLVLVVILGFSALTDMVDQMSELDQGYNFFKLLEFVLLSLPAEVFDYLPFAALVGCLAGLGSMASNSELAVMRSAGVSTGRIVWMVMRPAIVILLAGLVISEFIAPYTETIARSERAIALQKPDALMSKEGIWHREGNQFMEFIGVQPHGVIYGVTIYNFDSHQRLLSTLFALRAIYNNKHWTLEDVRETRFVGGRVEADSQQSMDWKTTLSPKLLNILMLDPIDLSIKGLWQYAHYLDRQGLNSALYRLAFWKKLLQPLSTLALVLVGISFVFGPLREATMGFRIFIGVLFGIAFRTLEDMLAPASMVYGFPPVFASLLPVLLCALVGIWLLRRAR